MEIKYSRIEKFNRLENTGDKLCKNRARRQKDGQL